MNLNNVPNYYFEFGCDFNIFLQALDAKSKTKNELFKVAELQLCKGHGVCITRMEFEELYGEYAQIQINGRANQDNSDCFFELMITFPKQIIYKDFILYNSDCFEDFDEMKAIINRCFELTVKNSY